MKLSDIQKEIVDFRGHLLVKAPPGSGKTFTLTKKIEKVQLESNKRIIALTFSNKAAEELKERIADKNNVVVGTIHSFCQDLVMSRGFQIGLPEDLNIVNDVSDKLFVIREVINESSFIKQSINDTSDEYLTKILNFIKKQKQNFINPAELLKSDGKYNELYYEIYNGYNNKMLNQKMIDFDDLLYYAYLILSREETKDLYKKVYGHLYVDEAQDLNYSQYQIIKLLASLVDDVMLIGDPSQAIYKFMGSNKRIMEETFLEDFNATVITLNENYRSAKKIVQLINLLKDENESISKYPIEGEIYYNRFVNEAEEAHFIVDKIKDLLEIYGTNPNDIAILGRNAYLFKEITKLLKENDINYNMGPDGNVLMESDYGNILLEYIKLHTNPYNERLRNYFKELLKLESNDFKDIVEKIKRDYIDIYDLVERSLNHPFYFGEGMKNLIEKVVVNEALDEDDRFLINEDLLFLQDNWINFIKRSNIQNKNLKTFMNEFIMGKTMSFSFEGISILTVHKAKGLQFDITFVVGLNEGTLPDYRAVRANDLSEEDNNVYVALSRARRTCYISSVEYKMMPWGNERKQDESRYVSAIRKVL